MGRVHTNFVAILKKLTIAKDWNSVKHFSPTAFDISSSKFLPVKNRAIYLLFCPRTSLTEKHHFGSARFIMNIENKIAPMVSRQVAFLRFHCCGNHPNITIIQKCFTTYCSSF